MTNIYSQSYHIYQNDTINRTNVQGLKNGRWINFKYCYDTSTVISDNNIWLNSEGFYKIIALSDSLLLEDCEHYSSGELCFRKGEMTFYCSGSIGNYYSVRDGYWIAYHPNKKNEISRIELYDKGIQIHSKFFREGHLNSEEYDRFYNNGKVQDEYLSANSAMFKRDFWAKSDSDYNRDTFYFDLPLKIDEAEIKFSSVFSKIDSTTFNIFSNSPKLVQIDSIVTSNYQLTVLEGKVPKSILPNEKLPINILYKPNRYDLRSNDTVFIYSNDLFPFRYEVYIDLLASDLNRFNSRYITELELENSYDKPLIFYMCDIGWHSHVELKNKKGKLIDKFMIGSGQCVQRDYSKLEKDTYDLFVESGFGDKFRYKLVVK